MAFKVSHDGKLHIALPIKEYINARTYHRDYVKINRLNKTKSFTHRTLSLEDPKRHVRLKPWLITSGLRILVNTTREYIVNYSLRVWFILSNTCVIYSKQLMVSRQTSKAFVSLSLYLNSGMSESRSLGISNSRALITSCKERNTLETLNFSKISFEFKQIKQKLITVLPSIQTKKRDLH